MNVARILLRPVIAAPFILDGIDALRRPAVHAERFESVQPTLEKIGLPPILTSDTKVICRITGAIFVVTGTSLALGKAPRTSASILAVLSLPIALINSPLWGKTRENKLPGVLKEFSQNLALSAGLVLTALDRQGRPSWKWRLQERGSQRRAQRIAAKEATD